MGDVAGSFEDRGRLAHTAVDRRRHEDVSQPLGNGGVGLDGRLQLRPAGEAQLSRDNQLGGG